MEKNLEELNEEIKNLTNRLELLLKYLIKNSMFEQDKETLRWI